ncbi:MAG: T9SS type A sorting domain-containing protein, partial [Bacteroidota bacterium]
QCGPVLTDPDGDFIYTVNDTLNPNAAFNFNYYVYTAAGPVTPGTSLCDFSTGYFESDTAFATCSSGVSGNNRRYVTPPQGVINDSVAVVCFSQCGDCPPPAKVLVTYQVNMANEIFTGNFNTANDAVVMAGANFWPNCGPVLTDPDGDAIYTFTDTLPPGASLNYNFYIYNAGGTVTPGTSLCNLTTGFFESDTAFANCASGVSGDNRTYTVPTGVIRDSTDAVCFGDCGECEAPSISILTFQVDMSNEILSGAFSPSNDLMAVAGGSYWPNCGLAMSDPDGDSIYTALDTVTTGSQINYNFYVFNGVGPITPGASLCDGTSGFFESDTAFANCVTATGTTRTYTASMGGNDTIPVVCFAQCETCQPFSAGPSIPVTFQVNLRNEILNGNFDPANDLSAIGGGNFSPTCGPVLTDTDGDSIYTHIENIPVGSVVSYRYFIYTAGGNITPGTTLCDMTTGFFESTADFVGCSSGTQGQSRVYTVPSGVAFDVIPVVCFSECGDCTTSSPTNEITFKVDMSKYAGPFSTVNINGNFNGFCGSCDELQDPDGDMVYEITLDIIADSIIYLFTVDGFGATESFSGGESCTRTVVSPQGASTYRAINGIDQNIELDVVCWNECVECFNLVTFRVDMSKYTQPFNTVNLSADFNSFCSDCALMQDPDGDDIYEIAVQLFQDSAEFKFSLDNGSKIEALQVGSSCTKTTTSPQGVFTNRFLKTTGDTTLAASCWSFCATCDAVSIEPGLERAFFSIHPNRVQDAFTVSFGLPVSGRNQLQIMDATGKIVYQQSLAAGSREERIQVSNWAKGIYLVRFLSGDQFQVQKVLVE